MNNLLVEAKRVLNEEASSIMALKKSLDKSFLKAMELVYATKTHVVFTGVGKSGIIAQKIATTFSSTGTPSLFLHSGEALHGDSGVIPKNGVCIIISHSGNTEELVKIVPVMKKFGCKIILITSNKKSKIAKYSDVVLNTFVKKEACSLNLVPTTSTTVTLALGDALTVALMKKKRFTKKDFSLFHPGGLLGKSLLLRVEDLTHKGEEIPMVNVNDSVKDAIVEISSKRLGMTLVMDNDNLKGTITDGDLRRAMENNVDLRKTSCESIMTKNPKTIKQDVLAAKALKFMEDNKINGAIVVEGKKIKGIMMVHDIIKEGILS